MHPIEHFCCQNSSCPAAGQRGRGNLSFRGWSGKGKRIRLFYCRTCKAHCSERKGTVLEEARLSDAKALARGEAVENQVAVEAGHASFNAATAVKPWRTRREGRPNRVS